MTDNTICRSNMLTYLCWS